MAKSFGTRFGSTLVESIVMFDAATYFAWFVIAFLFLVVVWLIVFLGSLPKKIAAKRNHPQVDAINAASWIGLALAGAGWPIAFVWAFLRSGQAGAGTAVAAQKDTEDELDRLRNQVAELERQLTHLKTQKG